MLQLRPMSLALCVLLPALPVLAAEPCCSAVAFQANAADDVTVQLVSVKRTSENDITVTWRYQNKNKAEQHLAKGAFGWSDGYRLTYEAEVLDLGTRTKYKVAKDTAGVPLAAKHETAGPTKGIWLRPGKSMDTWAKFLVPASVSKVTVTLPGASQAWEGIAITP